MNEALGFIHWHWRSGWSLLGLVIVAAIIVVIAAGLDPIRPADRNEDDTA
jgi:hypothetical protein